MKVKIDVKFNSKEFSEIESKITKDIFGLSVCDVYFNLNMFIDTKNHNFINFSGISGSGKTVIKNKIKDDLISDGKKVLDFDDLIIDDNMTIIELMNIKSGNDEILKILSGFGLFEMRLLFSKISNLSQGQQKRIKYAYLFNNLNDDEETHILIDEFLTFVDSMSSISFAVSVRKYLQQKNVKLFTFGVNDNIVGQFEDISFILGNSSLSAIIENGNIQYVNQSQVTENLND